MKLLVATILLSFSLLGLGQAPPTFRFQIETLHEGIPQPMHLVYGPDSKIYFIEIAGKLQCFDLKSKSLTTAGEVVVTNTGGIKNYQIFSADFKTPEKSGPIHLVFTHPKRGRLMFLDWVQFD